MEKQMKRYIPNLKFGTWHKRLYLMADDAPEMDSVFEQAMRELEKVGSSSRTAEEFLDRAIALFKERGFTPFKP